MATIFIEGKAYNVNKSSNLLEACLSLGFDIPYFCWHPALGSVGSCRQCAVKQYANINDQQGKIIISCMTPSINGTLISINDNEAKYFRQSIIEFLMINHPHDCPVCQEGGHCHLQDMIVMVGKNFRRYNFKKRTYNNQYLGPFISHEMNRCITCYRCVRFYKDYADGNDFGVYGIHNNIYFGRYQDGILENEFSNNLIEICPTGVFTDKTYSENYSRKWDIQYTPSICHQCSIGCNIIIGERNGEVQRIENRYNGNINHYFLCDLGRFSYDYINSKNRPYYPLKRINEKFIKLNIYQTLKNINKILKKSFKIIGIGSARSSIESNITLRNLVGEKNFYIGCNNKELKILKLILNILRNSGIYTPSIKEIEDYDAVLILGEDITQTGARIALAVRQAIKGYSRKLSLSKKIFDWQIAAIMNIGQRKKFPLFITNVDRTRLDDVSNWSYYASVDDQAKFGFAIANAINKNSPPVNNLDNNLKNKIKIIVKALTSAKKPLIISGSNTGSKEIIQAAYNISLALNKKGIKVGISFITSINPNSMGLTMIGGKSLEHALNLFKKGDADCLIVLENDLYRHLPFTYLDSILDKIKNLIVLDNKNNILFKKANFILPTNNFAESDGTIINQEGRAQRFFRSYNPYYYNKKKKILESWKWLYLINCIYNNKTIKSININNIIKDYTNKIPQFYKIKDLTPKVNFRINGQKLARKPNRYSGITAMDKRNNIKEINTLKDLNNIFNFSMEGNNSPYSPRKYIAFPWMPGWNSPQSWNKFQNEVGGNLFYGDPGIRLLEKNKNKLNFFKKIPKKIKINKGEWYITSYWHLFGSEETSQHSFFIKKQIPKKYVIINKIDALKLKINNGNLVTFNVLNEEFCLTVKYSDLLSRKYLGLPLGFPGLPLILNGEKAFNLREVKL